ncbi:hypothetical protein CH252_04960 [Rhodococcus sp. 06-1477-1B]|nr:hypothetical protein CH252_04960 [Rhodococcus sp. 06-1477-1B]
METQVRGNSFKLFHQLLVCLARNVVADVYLEHVGFNLGDFGDVGTCVNQTLTFVDVRFTLLGFHLIVGSGSEVVSQSHSEFFTERSTASTSTL